MAKLLVGLLVLVFLTLVLIAAAITLWGVWGVLGVLVFGILGVFTVKRLGGLLLKRMFMAPFAAKGAVLKDAGILVHGVAPASAPAPRAFVESDADDEPDAEDEDDDEPEAADDPDEILDRELAWYHLDVTITPQPPSGQGFTLWEPSELVLVGPEAKSITGLDDMDEGGEGGGVRELEVWKDGAWTADEEGKYFGPQRVKLLVGLPRAMRRARFRYYFGVFGDVIDFPASDPPAAPA